MNKASQILKLVQPFVDQGKILPRTLIDINKSIDDFVLIYKDNQLLACAGLKDCQEGSIGEIYSLAVAQGFQNTGLSSQLLDKIVIKAKKEKFTKIFALTKHGTNWFIKNGFAQMNISDLPYKRQKHFNYDRNSLIFFKEVN